MSGNALDTLRDCINELKYDAGDEFTEAGEDALARVAAVIEAARTLLYERDHHDDWARLGAALRAVDEGEAR